MKIRLLYFHLYHLLRVHSRTGIVILFSIIQVTAQQAPPNIGFETGSFAGWSAATGQCCPVYAPVPGFDPTRHAITSGPGTDVYSNGLIPVTAPGSLYSARLGNDSGSAESEVLDYFFTVPSDSLLLVVRFAVILENYNHPPSKQPRFRYAVQCSMPLAGCIEEEIVAGDPAYNFQVAGQYEMLGWETRVIDISGYQGVTINLHFETGDCEPGGHFGYAYVDAGLIPARIDMAACNPGGSVTLMAPEGLDVTWFDGTTADSVIIQQPQPGTVYTLETSCGTVLSVTLDDYLPVAGFTAVTSCDLQVSCTNHSIVTNGTGYTWDFGDGHTSTLEEPTHTYNHYGIYEIGLVVEQNNHCRSESFYVIEFTEPADAGFHVSGTCVNRQVSFINESSVPPGQSYGFQWFINGTPAYTEPDPVHIFTLPGIYELMLVAGQAPCGDTATALIEIVDDDSCFIDPPVIYIPNSFTPNGDGINDYFAAYGTDNSIKITIYNRFGERIFTGRSWDGRHNQQECPPGVYAVTVTSMSTHRTRYGTVSLVR